MKKVAKINLRFHMLIGSVWFFSYNGNGREERVIKRHTTKGFSTTTNDGQERRLIFERGDKIFYNEDLMTIEIHSLGGLIVSFQKKDK